MTTDIHIITDNTDTTSDTMLDVEILTLLVSRLAQILAQEVDLLDAMDTEGLAELQHEKKAMVEALEKQQQLIASHPDVLEDLTQEEREDMQELAQVFSTIMQENFRRLTLAREANRRVVEAITEVANQHARQGYYTQSGQQAGEGSSPLSLNQSI